MRRAELWTVFPRRRVFAAADYDLAALVTLEDFEAAEAAARGGVPGELRPSIADLGIESRSVISVTRD